MRWAANCITRRGWGKSKAIKLLPLWALVPCSVLNVIKINAYYFICFYYITGLLMKCETVHNFKNFCEYYCCFRCNVICSSEIQFKILTPFIFKIQCKSSKIPSMPRPTKVCFSFRYSDWNIATLLILLTYTLYVLHILPFFRLRISSLCTQALWANVLSKILSPWQPSLSPVWHRT